MKLNRIAALFAAAGLSTPAFATNGMNQAGYGPVSESMGGTSIAYDNGGAALINNPATLGFMAPGTSRLDIGFGDLRPLGSSNGQESTAKDFFMPGFAYVRRDGDISWGVGIMAQGGMGTEYPNSSIFGTLNSLTLATGALTPIADPGKINRATVGVGRVMFPLTYSVSPDLNIAASIDYVWAGMNLSWMMDGSHFASFLPGSPQPFGTASGSLVTAFQGAAGAAGCGAGPCFSALNYGFFDFDNGSKFKQKATGDGWAGNLGFTYKVSPKLTIGGVYHGKTSLSDMKTGSDEANVTFNVTLTAAGSAALTAGAVPAGTAIPVKLTGQVMVRNFQWPETFGFGTAYQVNDQWQVQADYKRINWASVMKNFSMTFVSSAAAANGSFANKTMDLTYYQNWKNQDVLELGAAYKYNDALTLRFGGNFGNNPVPDGFVSPLFPAIMKDHYTAGFGYAFNKVSSLDAAFVYAPKVSVTNNWSAAGGTNQNISLGSDFSYQLMYSHRF